MHPSPAHLQAKWLTWYAPPARKPAGVSLMQLQSFQQAMAFFDTLAVLVSLLAFFTAGAFAQEFEHVTLWQFGTGRLLPGAVTLPMQPLGTLGDGSATTYLYQVIDDVTVTTTNSAGLTTQTIPTSTASRTIVASASGWVEQFGGDQIACGFVNSGFGECFDGTSTVPANSGKPNPQVVLIATPTSVSSASPPPSTSSSPAVSAKASGGVIAGGVIAGCFVLSIGLAVCVLFRRRRRQEFENKFAARSYDPKPTDSNTNSNTVGNQMPLPFAVFAAGPQLESALDDRPTRHKRDYSASTQSQSSGWSASHSRVASASDLPPLEIPERGQNDGSEAPPAYPTTPHFRPREKN